MFSEHQDEEKKGIFSKQWGEAEDVPTEERFSVISVTAIIALIGGVLSQLCFVNRSLTFIPMASLIFIMISFWRIRRSDGTITGGGLVRTALFLILIPMTALPVQTAIFRAQMTRQAREFFPMAFHAAQQGDSFSLYQLEQYSSARQETEDEAGFWQEKMKDQIQGMEVAQFLHHPALLTLAALGENATITYDQTLSVARDPKIDTDYIAASYAVTFTEFGEKKTFFLPVYGERTRDNESKTTLWRIGSFGKKPLSLTKRISDTDKE